MCGDLHVCSVDTILNSVHAFFAVQNLIFCLPLRSWLKFHLVCELCLMCVLVGEFAMCMAANRAKEQEHVEAPNIAHCVYVNMVHERALIEPATCVACNQDEQMTRADGNVGNIQTVRPRNCLSIPHGSWNQINPNKCWTKNNISRLVTVVYVACSRVGSAWIFRKFVLPLASNWI